MAKDKKSSTVQYSVSNVAKKDRHRHTKSVAFVWEPHSNSASLRVSLVNYGVQVPVGVGLAGTLTINLCTEVDFESGESVRALGQWIERTVRSGPSEPASEPVVRNERARAHAVNAGSSTEVSLSFCMTDQANEICLAWNETEQRAYYLVQLSGVEVDTPVVGARSDVDVMISCSAEVGLENFSVAQSLSQWILSNVPATPAKGRVGGGMAEREP